MTPRGRSAQQLTRTSSAIICVVRKRQVGEYTRIHTHTQIQRKRLYHRNFSDCQAHIYYFQKFSHTYIEVGLVARLVGCENICGSNERRFVPPHTHVKGLIVAIFLH